MRKIAAASLIVFIFLGFATSQAQSFEFIDSFVWTHLWHAEVSGNYAFATFPNGLEIINISNPATPIFVGHYNITLFPGELEISNNYVYIANRNSGLQIVNTADPFNPFLAATYTGGSEADDIFVTGNRGYLSLAYSGFQILDLSEPSSPLLLGEYGGGGMCCIEVSGDYAYALGPGLKILNVADPAHAIEIGECNVFDFPNDIDVSEDRVFAGFPSGFEIIDITDSALPVPLGIYQSASTTFGIAVRGNYVYVATDHSGIEIVNVNDPSNPTKITNYVINGSAHNISFIDSLAYLANESSLQIVDFADPSNPVFLGGYDASGMVLGIDMVGDYVYLADESAGLKVMNISNPERPALVGACREPASACAVDVSGNFAYMACVYDTCFKVIDVTDPTHPVPFSRFELPEPSYGISVIDNYAYVANGYTGLQIIDVGNPANPNVVACVATTFALNVKVVGQYAYVADGYGGLSLVQIGGVEHPVRVSYYATGGRCSDVDVSGAYAYVADQDSGLFVINISDPFHPSLTATYPRTGAYDIHIYGNYAFLGGGQLDIIDISNPMYPSYVGSCDTPGFSSDAVLNQNILYVADVESMVLLRVNTTLDIAENEQNPRIFSILKNYPNPFNTSTSIKYSLPQSGLINLSIYNLLGQKIQVLFNGIQQAGEREIIWNANNFTSGIYFAKLEIGGHSEKMKMVLLK